MKKCSLHYCQRLRRCWYAWSPQRRCRSMDSLVYVGARFIWACIIPVLLARKSRTLAHGVQGFVVPGGNLALGLVLIFGVLTAVFHMMAMANLLPAFKG
ncbi:tryptophan-specific transporter [Vibrio cholerae RC385]|nr:tryptophan-specific transporter [Vibrio cholerae RC385]